MRNHQAVALALLFLILTACTTTKQHAASDFRPPEGNYKIVVMQPDIEVGLVTAGGTVEPREDWTTQARENVLAALRSQQSQRGGNITIATSARDAGGDSVVASKLDRLHEAVGRSIQIHKYTPGFELPTKSNTFDWTLGTLAVEYGRSSGYDYALFLYAANSFSSGGRKALQAVSMLGCVVGVCFVPEGGSEAAFASLVDLKSGRVVWFNYLSAGGGDIRTVEGARGLVDALLEDMKPGNRQTKS